MNERSEDATMAAAKMQPKCKKKAALRAVSAFNADAINETGSACMPRVEQTKEGNPM